MNERLKKINYVTIQGIFINIGLIILKMAAGVISHSGAIVADAFHSFSDLSTDLALLWGAKAAAEPADSDHEYGHGRINTIVCAGIGILLFAVGGAIFFGGAFKVFRVLRGEMLLQPGWFACFAAFISIISKEWLYQRTVAVGKETENLAVIANAWHHRSDAFSSIGVMLGILGAIVLGGSWRILDPIAAVVVSVFIIKVAFSIVGESFYELMEGSLSDDEEVEIARLTLSVPGVNTPHRIRTRRIGYNVAIELHIKVNNDLDIRQGHDIATKVEDLLKERFGRSTFISVHVEPIDDR
jgi:cation diffusion facilitator family transporter